MDYLKIFASVVLATAVGALIYFVTKPSETESTDPPISEEDTTYAIVPAYFYPTLSNLQGPYTQLSESTIPMKIIINPANGEDAVAPPNADWVKAIELLAHKYTLGYVYTSYGERPISDVKNDVLGYLNNGWNVRGFFFDETVSDNSKLGYYDELSVYIKGINHDLEIVFNPGVPSSDRMLELCDVSIEFEGTAETFQQGVLTLSPDHVNRRYSACIVHGASTFDQTLMDEMIASYTGVYLLEDDTYNHLPAYWDDMQNSIVHANK